LNIANAHDRNDAIFATAILSGWCPQQVTWRQPPRTPDDGIRTSLRCAFGCYDSPKFMRNATFPSEIFRIAFNLAAAAGWVTAHGGME
jgi:hypothetical protein